ncbi:MAG: hypothetical protein AB3N22_10315 [Ruegeria sp.]
MDTAALHPMATGHIPAYVTAADGSDYLFNFMVIFTVVLIVLLGVGYFTLHALPERMAHKSNHSQFQFVGILALLALFTHNNIFWVIAILVAGFRIPDYLSPIRSMATSLSALATQGNQATTEREAVEPEAVPLEVEAEAETDADAEAKGH